MGSAATVLGKLVNIPTLTAVSVAHAFSPTANRLAVAISNRLLSRGRCVATLMGRDNVRTHRSNNDGDCRRGGTPHLFLATTGNGGLRTSNSNGCDMALAGAIPTGINGFSASPSRVRIITFIRNPVKATDTHVITGTVRLPLLSTPTTIPTVRHCGRVVGTFVSSGSGTHVSLSASHLGISRFWCYGSVVLY